MTDFPLLQIALTLYIGVLCMIALDPETKWRCR